MSELKAIITIIETDNNVITDEVVQVTVPIVAVGNTYKYYEIEHAVSSDLMNLVRRLRPIPEEVNDEETN